MKKIFIISLVLLIIVLIFLGIYNFAFKKNSPEMMQAASQTTSQAPASTTPSGMPVTPQKIIAISDLPVIGATFDKKNNDIMYYSAQDGTTWKSGADGKGKQQISTAKVSGIVNVLWSADRSKVLTTVNSNGINNFYEYDLALQKATALKKGLDTAVWDDLGDKIFYKYFDQIAKTRTLNVANPDGSGWQKMTDLSIRNISVAQIPSTSLVSFWNSPAAGEETQLQTVGVAGGQAQTIFSGKYGADYLWSPNGAEALVSSLTDQNSKKMTLGVVKLDGSYIDLGIPTFASKCVWSADSKTIYYALPGGIPDGATLPDDYQNNKFTTADTFWKIDITTGMKDRLVDPADAVGTYDSSNLFISPDEDALFFTNKVNKKLYKIAL